MIFNYLKTALRNFRRYRNYSWLHLLGLMAGLTSCLLIGAYLWNESQYDQFHGKGARICRLNTDLLFPDQTLELALAAGPAAPALLEAFPVVENYVRLARPWGKVLAKRELITNYEDNLLFADPGLFTVFDFRLQAGDAATALQAPNSVVLTPEIARHYFGRPDPLGESLIIDDREYLVTGIVSPPPRNSHIQFDLIASFATWAELHPAVLSSWTWTNCSTYLLLAPSAEPAVLERQLPAFLAGHFPADETEMKMSLHLEPFREIHFGAPRLGELQAKGNRTYLWFLSLTAIFILGLAVANYVNLSTALSAQRAREIGVRKTIGATRRQVAFQYLSEGVILTTAALAMSLLASGALLPLFGDWLGRDLYPPRVVLVWLLPLFFGGAALLGGLAALYPAVLLSGLKPVLTLKGRGVTHLGRKQLRQALSVLQFAVSITLVLGAMVVGRQLHYLLHRDLGFDRNEKLIVSFGSVERLNKSYETIKAELARVPGVSGVAFSSHVPSESPHGIGTLIRKEKGDEVSAEVELYLVDFDFIDLYGLKVIAGRGFDSSFQQDTSGALILNRSALPLFGFSDPQAIIGREFEQWGRSGRVIGVVEDFNYKSLHQGIGAITFQVNPSLFEKLTVGLAAGAPAAATIEGLERSWQEVAGNLPFTYSFLDERLAQQYDADRRLAQLVFVFSGLAILLACLGLVGLVAYTCRRRSKDIAVRKVFGATLGQILWELYREFSRPALWAWVLAVAPAWWILDRWLGTFAYHVSIRLWAPLAAGALMLALVAIVVGWQSYATAKANPVTFLKEE